MSTAKGARLGRYVLARRTEELDWTQLEVDAAGGPSNTKQTEIENGRLPTLTRQMARKLDRGLRWEPGSARRVWDGGEPTPLIEGLQWPEETSSELRRYVERAPGMDEETRAEILRRIGSA